MNSTQQVDPAQVPAEGDNLRYTKMPLIDGSGVIPALGFGTLIPNPIDTKKATRAALEAGFRQLDSAERYRNEKEVGEAIQEVFQEGKIKREEVFIATKLWNNNHRPERVKPAFEASLKRLQLDYLDLYLIHTPFAFKPGDEQEPKDIDYLRQKVVVVDQAPRQNAAKAFLAALRDDWKPKIQTVKLGIPARCR